MTNDYMNSLSIQYAATNSLIPYANNSRTHDQAQVAQIAGSIKAFGFTNPILIDSDNSIIAGHGRVLAAQMLKLDRVPTITLTGLSDTQKRAYIIADNKLALNAGWDNELLMLELDALNDEGFDLDLTGFSAEEISELSADEQADDENKYTDKTDIFTYEADGVKPALDTLLDDTKTLELLSEIEASNLSKDEKHFLRAAAYRHTVFNFENIANYYAHSEITAQTLIEKSALVIIDYKDAIAGGFVTLTKELQSVDSDD